MTDAQPRAEAHWKCDVCGVYGTPDEHVLLTTGSLTRGTLRAHTFCRDHDPRRAETKAGANP